MFSYDKNLLLRPEAPRVLWTPATEEVIIKRVKELQPQFIVTTGCFNYINQEKSTKEDLVAGLHEEHQELFALMRQLKEASPQSKALVFLNDSAYLIFTKKVDRPLDTNRRKEAVLTNDSCAIDHVVTFLKEEELLVYSGQMKNYVLVKGSEYLNKEITMSRGHCQLIVLRPNRGTSSSKSNREWLSQ